MSIGDSILGMMGNTDPRLQLLAALQQGGTSGTPTGAGGTSAPAPGAAATATPGAAPAQPPQPEVYKSPPELMQLYSQMLNRQNRASNIDNGIGLIASAFARPENRASIRQAMMSGASGGSGMGNDPMNFIKTVMDMQTRQANIRSINENRQRLPAIAKQYGIDLNTAQFLFDSGQLDEVLSALVKPDNQIVDLSDGTKAIVNKTTGEIGEAFGPAKKREMEVIEDASGNKFAIWKDTKERVGDKNIVDGMGATQMEKEWRLANEERAKAGNQPIAFEDYVHQRGRSGAGASNLGPTGIDYGDPPKDMAWQRTEDGSIKVENGSPVAVPIVGSKLYTEQTEAAEKKEMKAGQERVSDAFVDTSIGDALSLIGEHKDSWLPGVTGVGSVAQYLPGEWDARKLANSLNTIKSNLGFKKLQQMREASPTGGALGQVSDFENKLLQQTFGSFDQGGDDDTLARNLYRVQFMADAIVNGVKGPNGEYIKLSEGDPEVGQKIKAIFTAADKAAETFMSTDHNAPPTENPEIDNLLKKYGVTQ